MTTIRRLAALLLPLFLAMQAAAQGGPEIRHNIVLPAKPAGTHVLHVCRSGEIPGCFPGIREALADPPARDNLHIIVHCGHYRGDTVPLAGHNDLVIEGKPCANGRLPILDADGKQSMRMGAYPWTGEATTKNLWLENLELTNNHTSGSGTPVRIGGTGDVMFKNVVINENDNGILVSTVFDGTLYVVDSVFRNNGYGRRARTHHIYLACPSPCRLVVLDSYFGKVLQGGNHIRVRGDLYAVGNMFIDEPGGEASRIINTSAEACNLRSPTDDPPCVVAENYMLKNQTAQNREFINLGDAGGEDPRPNGMVVRNNAALALRDGAVLVGNKQPNSRLFVRGNVMVVKDPPRCGDTGIGCLLTIPEFGATLLESNLISGDPSAVPATFIPRPRRR